MNWQTTERLPDMEVPVIIYYSNGTYKTYSIATLMSIDDELKFTINEPFIFGTSIEIKNVSNWKYFEMIH